MKNMPPVMKSEIPMASARPAAERRVQQDSLLPVGGDVRDLPVSGARHDSPEPFQRLLQKSLHDQERGRNRDGSSEGDRNGGNQESAPGRATQAEEVPARTAAGKTPREGTAMVSEAETRGEENEESATQSQGQNRKDETNALVPAGGLLLIHEYRDSTPETLPAERRRLDGSGRGTEELKAAAAAAGLGSPEIARDPRTAAGVGGAMSRSGAPSVATAGAEPAGAGADAERKNDVPAQRETVREAKTGITGTSLFAETKARMTRSGSTGGPDGAVPIRTGVGGSAAEAGIVPAQGADIAEKGGREAAGLGGRKIRTTSSDVPSTGGRGENPAPGERHGVAEPAEALRGRRTGTETPWAVRRTGPEATAVPVDLAGDGGRDVPNAGDPQIVVRSSATVQEGKSAGITDAHSPDPAKADPREGMRRPLTGEKQSPAPTSGARTTDAVPRTGYSDAGEASIAGTGQGASLAAEGPVRLHLRQAGKEAFAVKGGTRPGEQGVGVDRTGTGAPEPAGNPGAARAGYGGEPRPENGGTGSSSGSPTGLLMAGRVHQRTAVDTVSPPPSAFAAAVADASRIRAGGDAVELSTAGGQTTLLKQVVEASQPLLQQGGGRVLISLTPPNLGTLDIDVRVRRDTVELFVVANNPDVQQTICSHVEQLRKALVDQGLNMERFQVVVGDRSAGQQGGDPRQEGMAGWHGDARGDRGYHREVIDEGASAVVRATVRPEAYQSSPGGINVFI